MLKNPPKTFTKYASSPTLEGIKKSIAKFYCCTSLELKPGSEPDTLAIINKRGQTLSLIILETTRGFYFGLFDKPTKGDSQA